MEHEQEKVTAPQLPLSVITVVDISRLRRELTAVSEFMTQAEVRKGGRQAALPRTSHSLEELAQQNQLNLLVANDRQKLNAIIENLHQNAPVIHISFASDPPATVLTKLITWLRKEIDPALLLQVGLQPSIAAGCIVRTPSKYFDFSLRRHFESKQDLLLRKLTEGVI
ncbi:MAG TPA: hypothetical protein VLF90_01400 [Patescibacteria group bacterium]|nr:hypothetical protein [Patescibacteria group bacterium]